MTYAQNNVRLPRQHMNTSPKALYFQGFESTKKLFYHQFTINIDPNLRTFYWTLRFLMAYLPIPMAELGGIFSAIFCVVACTNSELSTIKNLPVVRKNKRPHSGSIFCKCIPCSDKLICTANPVMFKQRNVLLEILTV